MYICAAFKKNIQHETVRCENVKAKVSLNIENQVIFLIIQRTVRTCEEHFRFKRNNALKK